MTRPFRMTEWEASVLRQAASSSGGGGGATSTETTQLNLAELMSGMERTLNEVLELDPNYWEPYRMLGKLASDRLVLHQKRFLEWKINKRLEDE